MLKKLDSKNPGEKETELKTKLSVDLENILLPEFMSFFSVVKTAN